MLKRKKETYWSKFAYGYAKGVNHIVGNEMQQTIIKRLTEESDLGEVIEFGCGTGFFTKVIANKAKHVIATDLSDEMLEIAGQELKEFHNITIKKADCESTPFPSEKFDTVVMVNLIHFIKKPSRCLQESYRILKNSGLLLLVDYTGYGMKWFEKMKLGIRFFTTVGIPPRYAQSNLSPHTLSALVESEGFYVEKISLIGDKTKALYLKAKKIETNS
jgi:ubiquinone/menaquinone biosynthesis C-methylase UbiE